MTTRPISRNDIRLQLTLRITRGSMSFSVGNPLSDKRMVFEAYELNKSISAAANLRQAFASSELLMSGYNRALVLTDGDTMLVPADEYQPEGIETLYQHTFGNYAPASSTVVATPLAEHGAVAVTAVSKDLKTVVDDHFSDVRYLPLIAPVWLHLRHRCHGSHRRQLFAHFVEDRMWVFAFAQNRFKFCNYYRMPNIKDAPYYLLYVWKLLGMDAQNDELHLTGMAADQLPAHGEPSPRDWLLGYLRGFLARVVCVGEAVDFHLQPGTRTEGLPYDLMALYSQE